MRARAWIVLLPIAAVALAVAAFFSLRTEGGGISTSGSTAAIAPESGDRPAPAPPPSPIEPAVGAPRSRVD